MYMDPNSDTPLRGRASPAPGRSVEDLPLETIAALAGREPKMHRFSPPVASSPPRNPAHDTADGSILASCISPSPRSSTVPANHDDLRSPPLKAPTSRRPLPFSAPTDPAAQARRVSGAKPSPGTSPDQDKMVAVERNVRDANSRSSAANGDRPAKTSNAHANKLEDEIVVDTTSVNSIHSSPVSAASDQEDVPMDDAQDRSPEPSYPKRKRPSLNEPDEERMDRSPTKNDPWASAPRGRPPKAPQPTAPISSSARTVVLGYWRDSTVPDVQDRHAVTGFIDTRDRLRTRPQPVGRSGKKVPPEYLDRPGPWVTFERIVFDKHLIGLDHNQVKEYVKIRLDTLDPNETPEEAAFKDKAAAKEAIRRAAMHPLPDNLPPPQIAYGVDLPDYVVNASRPEKKRRVTGSYGPVPVPIMAAEMPAPVPMTFDPIRRVSGNLSSIGSPSVASAIQRSAIDLLPGTRPTKILLGYWRGSSEERPEDKHAVFGILGANDMFRVKVTRETRDGRPVVGNFPQGAGALWIHYDEVEFEKHIRHLSRPEVKEYVRVRQRQIDEGEKPSQRTFNEAKAVADAQTRVINSGGVSQSTLGTAGRVDTISFATAANLSREMGRVVDLYENNKMDPMDKPTFHIMASDGRPRGDSLGADLHQTRRMMDARDSASSIAAAAVAASAPLPSRSGRHSLPDGAGMSGELHAAGHTIAAGGGLNDASNSVNADRVERTNSLARREISRVEGIQQRNEQRAAIRDSNANGPLGGISQPSNGLTGHLHLNNKAANGIASATTNGNSRQTFSENMERLNKVWASQEATRLRAAGEDAKIYMGVKYERKQTGAFQGKLVSPGTILSIDGEDYVEYRVLTKPTFF